MFPSSARPLSDRESALLDLLLGEDFPGVEALRVQRETVRVRDVRRERGSIVLLEVAADAPRAAVVHTVPVETRVRGSEPLKEVLLFVKQGVLDSIELVDYSGSEPEELPEVETLEPPTSNGPG